MAKSLHSIIKRKSRRMFWSVQSRTRKRVIAQFAKKIGLIYFGFVNQLSDEHRIIKGFTVSSTHHDNSYCVGTFEGYDLALVDRSDAIWQQNGEIKICNWLILAIELHTKQEIPHFLLKASHHETTSFDSFFTIFHEMNKVDFGTFEEYGIDFISRFDVYAKSSDSIEIEKIFPANTARVIGAHFWPLSVEQQKNIVYIYADMDKITPSLLNTMLENGLWIARHLDSIIENI